MAIVKIKKIKKRMDHVINYVENLDKVTIENYDENFEDLHNAIDYIEDDIKTEKGYFVTGINCTPENALEQMQVTKRSFNKTDGILGFHIIHSYNEGEVTPELAHKIGVEFANELFGERFEVVIATHINTKHYHNHIVINSVSFKDGKKYYDNHENYSIIRKISNEICQEYGLNVMEEKKCKGSNINYDNFYKKYASQNNYQNTAKRDLDLAISQAYSYEDFKNLMKKMDYEFIIRSGKISIRGKDYKRNIRIERAFGEEYSIENIKRRILEEKSNIAFPIETYKIKIPKIVQSRKYKKTHKKAKGFKALYLHYCYLLKLFPNTKNIKKRLPASMRAEVNQMEKYSEEARFLNANNINTKNDLDNFKEINREKIKELLSKREKLWKTRKKETNEEIKQKICNDIAEITEEISLQKKKLEICESIETRIPKMKENLKELEEKNNERKEKKKDEYIK